MSSPGLSERSSALLLTCERRLGELARRAAADVAFSVTCAHRGREEQDRSLATGGSQHAWPDSPHNPWPARAFDFAPYAGAGFEEVHEALCAHARSMGLTLREGKEGHVEVVD